MWQCFLCSGMFECCSHFAQQHPFSAEVSVSQRVADAGVMHYALVGHKCNFLEAAHHCSRCRTELQVGLEANAVVREPAHIGHDQICSLHEMTFSRLPDKLTCLEIPVAATMSESARQTVSTEHGTKSIEPCPQLGSGGPRSVRNYTRCCSRMPFEAANIAVSVALSHKGV